MNVRRRATAAVTVALALTGLLPPAAAQVRPLYDEGAAGLLQLLQRLQTTASVLHIGAHPDDEDSPLIARQARGDHARVAYFSMNRGEGGQNLIGPEQGDALGVIRTEELLQERRLEGGDQLFGRAYDFGFSKTLEEAARMWGEQAALADMVRAIRTYRPLVVISSWTGSRVDGHGQHQLSGYLTPLAFRRAADPASFPEQLAEGLRPWQAIKLYVTTPLRSASGFEPTLKVETGAFDPVLGRTYFQLGMEGRSQQKSQAMGVPQLGGPQVSGLKLLETRGGGAGAEVGPLEGIDTTVTGIARIAGLPGGVLVPTLARIQDAGQRALAAFDPLAPAKTIPALADGLRALREGREELAAAAVPDTARAEADFLLARKEKEYAEALQRAAGVVVDALSDVETVTAGETLDVAVRVFYPDPTLVRVGSIELTAPAGWRVEASGPPPAPARPRLFAETPPAQAYFRVAVGADAPPTQPYWLRTPRTDWLYTWPEGAPRGLPFDPPPAQAVVSLDLGGAPVTVRQPVQYRLADPARGELRRDLSVVPALTLDLDPGLLVVSTHATTRTRRVIARLQKHSRAPLAGTVRLDLPAGWRAMPAEAPFRLQGKGERMALFFDVRVPPPAPARAYRVGARAIVEGATFDLTMRTLAYSHIQTHRVYAPAEATVQVVDLRVAPVRVGYIMGSGDFVPEAIKRMGVEVALLGEDDLARGEFSRFDTIVVGIRAVTVRPDYIQSNGRLLDWVRGGGTLIVQYQSREYVERGLAPFPARMEAASSPAITGLPPRVTDEDAPVTILQPANPAFVFPNRITPADFEGWVQERSVNELLEFDPRYVPLLESHDPGEGEQRGGELYARLGRGCYVYTAYSWFRQLPAGVPGAYRLFANLLSLPKASERPSPGRGSARGAGSP